MDPVADGARWDKQYQYGILLRPVQHGKRAKYRTVPRCVGAMLEGLQHAVRCKTDCRVAQLPGLDGEKIGPWCWQLGALIVAAGTGHDSRWW